MGQRGSILTQILGFPGWKVREVFFETVGGKRIVPVPGFAAPPGTRLVVRAARQWTARCCFCSGLGD